jgi:Fe-Mn family superoxide dismutase
MDYHYNKHDYGYDKKLQSLVNNTDLASLSLMEIVDLNSSSTLPAGVYNNAGQLLNHNIFWKSLTPHTSEQYPQGLSGKLEQKLIADFGSLDSFFKEFNQKSVNWFGSGWTYVAFHTPSGMIQIVNTQNGNYLSPPRDFVPLLNLDVWEHAYYIDHRNLRADYIRAYLQVSNWRFASEQYQTVS